MRTVAVVSSVSIELGVLHMLSKYTRKNNSPSVMHLCGKDTKIITPPKKKKNVDVRSRIDCQCGSRPLTAQVAMTLNQVPYSRGVI